MSAPNYPLRLDPLRRAGWKRAAELEGRTLAGWIKATCDRASQQITDREHREMVLAHLGLKPSTPGKERSTMSSLSIQRKVNWNMKATVRLNEHGKDIHEKYYRDLSTFANSQLTPPGGDFRPDQLSEPLWSIAQIFGRHLYNGCEIPFETMNFELEDVT